MHVAVIGAGMVGVSCAWALQRRGLKVTLLDRTEAGRETSHGNAGVLSPTSLLPFNHPGLWRQLPRLLAGKHPGFRTTPTYLLAHGRPLVSFMAHARPSVLAVTAQALHALITLSRSLHGAWYAQAGVSRHLREQGWLLLYRSAQAWQDAQWSRDQYAQHGLDVVSLDADALSALEPAVHSRFMRALWVRGAASVDDPGHVVRALARVFVERGGQFLQSEVRSLTPRVGGGWVIHSAVAGLEADQVVLAMGPWSRDWLRAMWNWRLPMIHERGYHMHYDWRGPGLGRPVYDTSSGYVLSPMGQGVRLSTGVELEEQHCAPSEAMLAQAQQAARKVFPLGDRRDAQAWHGSRPTLPDSRPMIGPCPERPGLWLALGHQHIGFSTGPGSGELLAALMTNESPPIDAAPFSPRRFGRFW
ncbi:MAG: NAD(P)/FAD-dependent oxidoreductase [Limnohabitans sp.]